MSTRQEFTNLLSMDANLGLSPDQIGRVALLLAVAGAQTSHQVIATEDDLGRVHEKLGGSGWLHFAVEDLYRCAWLIVESEHGELWATLGPDDDRPWVPALELLKGSGPLKLLQDLSPVVPE